MATTKKESPGRNAKASEGELKALVDENWEKTRLLLNDVATLEGRLDKMTTPGAGTGPAEDGTPAKKPCPCKQKSDFIATSPVPADGGPMIIVHQQNIMDVLLIFGSGLAFGMFMASLIIRAYSNGQQNILLRIKDLEAQKSA